MEQKWSFDEQWLSHGLQDLSMIHADSWEVLIGGETYEVKIKIINGEH